MKFVIFSPMTNTGGPFALYQLHDAIKQQGYETEVVFYQNAQFELKKFGCKVIYEEEVTPPVMAGIEPKVCYEFEQTDILIFPEILMGLMYRFHSYNFKRTAFWWLSWNNAPIQRIEQFDYATALSKSYHLFQSEYARIKASEYDYFGQELSDYTLFNQAEEPEETQKTIDACYLGRKVVGAEHIVQALETKFNIIKIEDMSQEEVTQVLQSSYCFLDFGIHPGKDRVPREAAMYNCIPIVRRAGAAKNSKDVPLPDQLKPFTAQMQDFNYMVDLVNNVKENFTYHKATIQKYKNTIIKEKETFFNEVKSMIEYFQ